jgi:hypothetical protein
MPAIGRSDDYRARKSVDILSKRVTLGMLREERK